MGWGERVGLSFEPLGKYWELAMARVNIFYVISEIYQVYQMIYHHQQI